MLLAVLKQITYYSVVENLNFLHTSLYIIYCSYHKNYTCAIFFLTFQHLRPKILTFFKLLKFLDSWHNYKCNLFQYYIKKILDKYYLDDINYNIRIKSYHSSTVQWKYRSIVLHKTLLHRNFNISLLFLYF